jgi:hypothetical protein
MKIPRSHVESATLHASLLQIAGLASLIALTSCGGGGSSTVTTAANGGSTTPPADFTIVSGGASCGSGGCGTDGSGGGDGSGGDGGDGGGGGLGQMRNILVSAHKPDGTALGSAELSDNLVSIYPNTYTGPFIVVFADDGSGNGQYYDESTKAWVSIGSTSLHILVPALTHHISANPLTEAAYQRALVLYGSESALTADNMSTVNGAVLAAINARLPAQYAISDITNYAVTVSDTTAANSLPNSNAGRYGTVLAGFAIAASMQNSSLSAPALAFMNQMTADLQDDGTINDSASVDPSVQAYGPDLSNTLAASITSAKSQYGAPTQPSAPAAANTCLNPAQFAVGTTWNLNYQDPSSALTWSFNYSVVGLSSFQNFNSALEVTDTITYNDGTNTFTGTGTSYFNPDLSDGIENYGSTGTGTASIATTIPTTTGFTYLDVASPPVSDQSFTLGVGQSQTLTSTDVETVYDSTGSIYSGPTTGTTTSTTTFTGYETVTVPAGTFNNACRYDSTSPTTVNGTTISSSSTTWITSSGQGVMVKSSSTTNGETSGMVLTSGTVNGVAVH